MTIQMLCLIKWLSPVPNEFIVMRLDKKIIDIETKIIKSNLLPKSFFKNILITEGVHYWIHSDKSWRRERIMPCKNNLFLFFFV